MHTVIETGKIKLFLINLLYLFKPYFLLKLSYFFNPISNFKKKINLLHGLPIYTLLLLLPFSQTIKSEESVEPKLNLAYTINMVKFIKWQKNQDTINFCLSSESKIYPYAKQLDRVSAGDERYIIVKINPASIKDCQIVYWDDNSQPDMSTDLIEKHKDNIVFITDSKVLQELGFNIQLFIRNLKIRFFIDIDSVQGKNYQISSKLLRLSKNLD